MTIIVDDLVTAVGTVLDDPNNDRWSVIEHLDAVNRAVSIISRLKPETTIVHVPAHPLIAGARQTLPAGAITIADVKSNTDGTTTRSLVRTTLADLHQASPQWLDWAIDTPSTEWAPDPSNIKSFYISPPRGGSTPGTAAIDVYQPPGDSALGDEFPLDYVWIPPVREYMLYSAWLKDAEYANDPARAKLHNDFFTAALA